MSKGTWRRKETKGHRSEMDWSDLKKFKGKKRKDFTPRTEYEREQEAEEFSRIMGMSRT